MKKILITGASGFTGSYLCEHLCSQNKFEIFGTYHREENYLSSPVKEKIKFIKIDLTDYQSVFNLISKIKPNLFFHLAGATSPAKSFNDPIRTFTDDVNSQINLLEAIRKNNLINSKILIVSSAEIYGRVNTSQLPINENTPLSPASPYAVSKIAQDYLGLQYFLSYKLHCVRVRPFNHIGPRQKPIFVASDFAKQIALIEKGKNKPVISVGNLSAKRDFTDVRDIVKAYQLALEKGLSSESYNIGSGISHSAKEILDILLSLSSSKITIKIDPQKMRPSDIANIICDCKKFTDLTGWQPKIPLKETLLNILDYWRGIV